jgi:phage/plasmid-associated DNA primase
MASTERLSAAHRSKLHASALSDDAIALMHWHTRADGALVIDYLKSDGAGETTHDGKPFIRWRLSDGQIAELKAKGIAKPGKYRSPKGNGCRLYHSHQAIAAGTYAQRLADRFVPLRITEGELKVESCTLHDPKRLTVGLGGVNSWRDAYDGGESRPLVDFDELPLEGREVRLCFDSDLHKPQVAAALRELAEFLLTRGAHVLIEVLPNGLDGQRLGADDLIYRHGPGLFEQIASIARSPFKIAPTKVLWVFTGQPADTRQRNVYLSGMLGRFWRRSPDGKDRWQQWRSCRWVDVTGDDDMAAAIESFAELQDWQNRELSTFKSLQSAFRRTVAVAAGLEAPGIIPFANGVLSLDGMTIAPHQPENGNTWVLPYDFNPAAACPNVEALLLDRLGDAESVGLFRAFARALLIGERLKAFLEITGASNTGKSVLANLLVALVGHENHAAGKLQRLEDHTQRFETLNLRGKRLAVFSECQDYSGQLQTLKALTGGDSIAAEIKGGRHVSFTFMGGVVLVGNGPIRASDPTGAVINRRRSLRVPKVVQACDERKLLDPDGQGGWTGELAGELSGFVNWALAMPSEDARRALARDSRSLSRAEAELEALLSTDLLAEWANERLAWAPGGQPARVGTAESDVGDFLFPSYLRFIDQQGRNGKPLSLRNFKTKLVDLLRDTLGLPLPPGSVNGGAYRERGVGSVVPSLRWRDAFDEAPGVVRHGFMARLADPIAGTDAERIGNGETPVGNGWNGWNGKNEVVSKGVDQSEHTNAPGSDENPYGAMGVEKSVPSVPSVPHKGSGRSASVPDAPQSVPQRPEGRAEPITVDGIAGWSLPGTMPKGEGATVMVLCIAPDGSSRRIERSRIKTTSAKKHPKG